MLRKLGYENVSLLVREGKDSGKSVAHLHYHIIPNIQLGSSTHGGTERVVLTDREVDVLLAQMRGLLSVTKV